MPITWHYNIQVQFPAQVLFSSSSCCPSQCERWSANPIKFETSNKREEFLAISKSSIFRSVCNKELVVGQAQRRMNPGSWGGG